MKMHLPKMIPIIVVGIMMLGVGCGSKAVRRDGASTSPLLSTYCQSCHQAPDPKDRTDSEWAEILAKHRSWLSLGDERYDEILDLLTSSN
jgi:hypothetical protein